MSPTITSELLRSTSQFAGRILYDHHNLSLALLVLSGTGAYLIFHRLILYPYFLSPVRHLPGPPLGHPIYGQFPAIINGEAGIPQREWVKEHGPVVRAVGPIGIERLIFMKPEALHKILVSDWVDYPRPGFMRDILGLTAGFGLLTVTGNEHKQMRKFMNPAFSIPSLMAQTDMYYDPIESLINTLQSQIASETHPEDGKEFMMYEWMSKVTLDIICETAFGYRTDSLHNPHNELAEAYEKLLNMQSGRNLARFIAIMVIPGVTRFLQSEWAYRHRHWFTYFESLAPIAVLLDSMHRIKQISATILAEKMRDSPVTSSDTEAKRDVMSLLVRARKADMEKDKGAYAMSDNAIMEQVLTFLGAGHETTASGLAWTLWLLANDQESQARLRDEVTPLLADNPRPDYRSLKDLRWLDCVVMESLRVLPPVPMTFRSAEKTDYIDGVLVPKGTIFYIPIRVVNTWKAMWGEDAEEFRPSRWLNLPKAYNPSSSVLTFIAGPHACIGKTMAIIEMKAVLASLIANFEFEPAYAGQVAQPTAAVTMKPKDNMPLRVRRVSRKQ
ncbi:putative cytochrome p450 [Lyophyllum shimeji]|uniref:Cytochrome p450 n=1 Tax=Lyophyllum shimeji TaxID=47721 RepID=A0A9P3ULI3_LYOSH|nr:putative cytochrome p450 [Lyophyllum shimeji]